MNTPFIIDAHAHLGPTQAFEAHHRELDAYMDILDRLGIELSFFSAMPTLENDFETGHRMTLEVLGKYPDRLRATGCSIPIGRKFRWPILKT